MNIGCIFATIVIYEFWKMMADGLKERMEERRRKQIRKIIQGK